MELVTEKGHTFAEELQKVSSIILAHDGAFGPCDLNCRPVALPCPITSLHHSSCPHL